MKIIPFNRCLNQLLSTVSKYCAKIYFPLPCERRKHPDGFAKGTSFSAPAAKGS